MSELPKSRWTIERVELVLFNLEHKRWQIWQEHSSQTLNTIDSIDSRYRTGTLFRRQIIRLLNGVRTILAESVDSARSPQFVMGRSPRSEDPASTAALQLAFSTESPCESAFWHLYLDYCDLTCNKYGITAANVRGVFRNEKFRRGDFSESRSLTRDDAADLVSVLPIAADWDLFGCWYRCWTHPSTRSSFPPSAKGAGKWSHPFYMARISPHKRSSYLATLQSTVVEAICCDLDSAALVPASCGSGKFFGKHYCTLPPKGTLSLQTYLAYGFLYDHIQSAMGFEASYIISFPIEVYDRTHFLQIQIVPAKSLPADCSLGQLWVDWIGSVHQLFWVLPVKRYLEEEVQRLSLAYFESRWEEALSEGLERSSKGELAQIASAGGSLPVLNKTFASTAHLLLPLKGAREGRDDLRWKYQPYSWRDYYLWRKDQHEHPPLPSDIEEALPSLGQSNDGLWDLGAQWVRDDGKDEEPKAADSHVSPLRGLEVSPDYGDCVSPNQVRAPLVKEKVINSRIEQLVDQHYDRMSVQLHQMILSTKHNREKALEGLRRYFSDAANRRKFNGTLGDAIAKRERVKSSDSTEQSVYQLMSVATGQSPGESDFLELERSLLQQPISEITSAFFSIGAAKTCTHGGRWTEEGKRLGYRAQRDALIADLDHRVNSLDPAGDRQPALLSWIDTCKQWAQDVREDIGKNFKSDKYILRGPLYYRYKMLRWPTIRTDFECCEVSKQIAMALDFEPSLGVGAAIAGHICPETKVYFPFQKVVNLAELANEIRLHCRGDALPKLSCWGTSKSEELFVSENAFYRVTDIVLKTRVVLLQFAYLKGPELARKVASATNLRRYLDPFAKDFGRLFVISKDEAVELMFLRDEPKIWEHEFHSVTTEILPAAGAIPADLPAIGGDNVALAFVWRVFEEREPRKDRVWT